MYTTSLTQARLSTSLLMAFLILLPSNVLTALATLEVRTFFIGPLHPHNLLRPLKLAIWRLSQPQERRLFLLTEPLCEYGNRRERFYPSLCMREST